MEERQGRGTALGMATPSVMSLVPVVVSSIGQGVPELSGGSVCRVISISLAGLPKIPTRR